MLKEINLLENKKIYFISDFHLGAPNNVESRKREHRIIQWLEMAKQDAAYIYIMGDIFDFWFEYKHTIPRGFIRFQGKLAELRDAGIPITFFTGNHDMWMFDYFTDELGIPVIRDLQELTINGKQFLIGHGDGLGPGDRSYKFIKSVFQNRFFQWIFSISPSILGFSIAQAWSKKSRITNKSIDEQFLGEKEWIYLYCKEIEQRKHHDYYIFGHRHLPLEMKVGNRAVYVNLGEWINYFTYAEYDGESLLLKKFE
jgi:UDP-2,3-diacylglucosamine hydrolase